MSELIAGSNSIVNVALPADSDTLTSAMLTLVVSSPEDTTIFMGSEAPAVNGLLPPKLVVSVHL